MDNHENDDLNNTDGRSIYLFETYTDRERLYNQFEIFRSYFNEWFDQALKLGELSTDPQTAKWRVLDAGCGEGLWGSEIIARYPKARVVGVDKDEEAIMTGNMVFTDKGDIHFYSHNLLEPFPGEFEPGVGGFNGEKFDVVIAWLVIQHIRDSATVYNNIVSMLKPGGVILLFDVTANQLEFPHPSLTTLAVAFENAIRDVTAYDAGTNHQSNLENLGFQNIDSLVNDFTLGGPTAKGWRMLNHTVSTLEALRRPIVNIFKAISGEEFDMHINKVKTESTPEMIGRARFIRTIARKSSEKS